MTYTETIDYLYNKLPMFSRMGSAAFKKDLTNTRILCEFLGNPQNKFRSIHVGGTNGKGSVSHMLASVLQTAGYKTGLYTSPHLYDFRERIKVNGIMADEPYIVDFTQRIQPLIESVQPSFFEITVAMAFDYFARQEVDAAVIEVGLGGRLDSTNIILPELSVITNIGWDHMNMLGNTLEEIAFEKAGIIKPSIPVVIGERQEETYAVFEKVAQQKQAPIFFATDQFKPIAYKWKGKTISVEILNQSDFQVSTFESDLPGIYQTKNICTVLTSLKLMTENGFIIPDKAIAAGLASVKKTTGLQGRWEVIHERPTIVLEVAHNKEGIEQMIKHLNNLSFDQLHIILGTVKDKDPGKVLEILPKQAHYYFTHAHIPRALDALTLKEQANTYSLVGDHYDHVNTALVQAIKNASEQDMIIVCGSIFLVAEVDRTLVGQKS